MTFGEKLRNARKEAGFSQEQLAEKMSVSRSAIAKWETDKGMPDVNNLKGRDKRDAVCLAKHSDASAIYALISNRKLSKAEWIVDFVVQPGIVEVLDRMNGTTGNYLVEKGNRQYFVTVTKDFITTRELPGKIDGKRFEIGNHRYTKGYQIM